MFINIAELDAVLFTFYWTDIKSIKKCLEQNSKGVFSDKIDIKPVLNLQYAYNPNPLRAAFFPVTKDTTIMFSNIQDGWFTLFCSIANAIDIKACYMRIMDDRKIENPSNYLYYINNSVTRVVYTLKDTKWVFYEQGAPLSFENIEYYKAKIKKERLNKNIMTEYCEKMGISINNKIEFDPEGAFSYELYWEGKFAGSKGTGPESLTVKHHKDSGTTT